MSQNKYIKLPIKGMHCRSCEILIEESLKELPHVKSVEVNYKDGEATIYHDGNVPEHSTLSKVVKEAGYEIGHSDELPLFSADKKEYANLGIAFLILLAIFLVLKGSGLMNINLNSSLSNPTWGLVVLIGLVAGFSTCMALVGGLVLGISTKYAASHPSATATQKFRPHLFFIAGRIISYAFLGGLLGALGTIFKFSAFTNSILTVLVGVVMLVMGLQLIDIFPRLSNFKLTLPKSVAKSFGFSGRAKEYSHKNAALIGALTFFLPCGFTQAMQLYAVSTGSFWSGALIMGLFALGTAPGLLSIGGLTSLIKGRFKARFFKVAGLAIICFALFNFSNAYSLAGLSVANISKANISQNDPNVITENGTQVVRMTEGNNGYAPNNFSLKKGIPVKWIINAKAPYSCASSIIVPKLNISKNLVSGENVIEFMPDQIGKIPFSCSMGMYTGVFNVYDGNAPTVSDSNIDTTVTGGGCGVKITNTGAATGGCGCGSGSGNCSGDSKITPNSVDTAAAQTDDTQIIKATYTVAGDISPNSFTVKAGKPVRFEILAKENGSGCMGTIQIQNLYENVQRFTAGQTIVMEFTPQTKGSYLIVCAMNIPHGTLKVE